MSFTWCVCGRGSLFDTFLWYVDKLLLQMLIQMLIRPKLIWWPHGEAVAGGTLNTHVRGCVFVLIWSHTMWLCSVHTSVDTVHTRPAYTYRTPRQSSWSIGTSHCHEMFHFIAGPAVCVAEEAGGGGQLIIMSGLVSNAWKTRCVLYHDIYLVPDIAMSPSSPFFDLFFKSATTGVL